MTTIFPSQPQFLPRVSPSIPGAGTVFHGWASRPGLPPALARELRALSRESDGELLGEALLLLGRRNLNGEQSELSREIFSWLVSEGESHHISASVLSRAREELELLEGRGTFGRRAERFLGRFVQEASEPSSLLGMTAGAVAFSSLRFATLSRLAASPGSYFWTRGAGARALASAAAFVPEVTAFWGTERLARSVLHPERPLSGEWGREWAGAALALGLLKLGGVGSASLFRRIHGVEAGLALRGGAFTRGGAPLFQQAGLLAGISLTQFLQPQLGLGPSHRGHFWSDAFATLLHFHVAGRFVGGQRFARDLAAREQGLAASGRTYPRDGLALNAPAPLQALQAHFATAGAAARPGSHPPFNFHWVESRAQEARSSSAGSGVRLRETSPEAPPPELSPELEKAIEPILLGIRQSVDDSTLHRLFAELPRGPEVWLPQAEFSREKYARRVLDRELGGNASFEMPLIGWLDGQGSPPHDHGGSSGFEFIAAGQATVRLYRLKSNGGLERISERVWPEGSVIPIAPEDIHVVTNQQGAGRPLVTLHAYRPFMNPELIRKFSEPESRK